MSSVEAYYPPSMQYMDAPVRDKAFDIFNALLDEGYDDDQAIPIAIAQAKKWAQANRHGQNSGTQCVRVVPHPDGGAIRGAEQRKRMASRNSAHVDWLAPISWP